MHTTDTKVLLLLCSATVPLCTEYKNSGVLSLISLI